MWFNVSACLALIVTIIIGARLQTVVTPYILIVVVIIVGFLVQKRIIKSKYYSLYIFTIALCMLWQTSLLGQQVVGGDVHSEYFVSSVTMQNGWMANYQQQYNTSIVVTVIAPFLAKFIDLVWVYKIIMPLCLAFVPFIMYYVFKKQIDELKAFWASLFFMVVPIMSLELIGIAKSMVAELFVAIFILVAISDLRFKYIILPIIAILTLFSHYTVGIMLLGYVGVCLILMLIAKIKKVSGKVGLVTLSLILLITTTVGYLYFRSFTAGEIVLKSVAVTLNIPTDFVIPQTETMLSSDAYAEEPQDNSISGILQQQQSLAKVGIGLDMGNASISGKIFRIVQIITEVLIVLGLFQLWRKRKTYNFTPEFIALILAGFGILGLSIIKPSLGDLINSTRIYQFSLFFLAPLFVLGCEFIWNKKWMLPSILLIYYIFTSGLMFEVTHGDSSKLDIPYSIPLSYERTGVATVVNQDDVNCAKWITAHVNNQDRIMSGYGTSYLMVCYMGGSTKVFDKNTRIPFKLTDNYKGYYFINSWETENNKIVDYAGIGLRRLKSLPNLNNMPIVYQSGDSIVRVNE